jgi:hypothetical protein
MPKSKKQTKSIFESLKLCQRKKPKLCLKLFYSEQNKNVFLHVLWPFFNDQEMQKVFHLFHCYNKITGSYTLPPFGNYQVTVLPNSKFYNFLGISYLYQFQNFQICENNFQINAMLYVPEYTAKTFSLSPEITLKLLDPDFQTCLAIQDEEPFSDYKRSDFLRRDGTGMDIYTFKKNDEFVILHSDFELLVQGNREVLHGIQDLSSHEIEKCACIAYDLGKC